MFAPATLYEYYQSQGQALPSVSARAPLYAQAGGQGTYTGTASQNTQLLNYLVGQNNASTANTTTVSNAANAANIGGAPIQTVTPPTTPNYANELASLITANTATINSANEAVTKAEAARDANQTQFQDLIGKLTGETTDRIAAEDAQGLPQMNKDLQDLITLGQTQTTKYLQAFNDAAQQTVPLGVVDTQQNELSRQHAFDAMLTNSLISAKQGNIATAQAQVDRAIEIKYGPIKQQIQNLQMMLELNYKDLSRADQKLADARSNELNLKLKQIDYMQQQDQAKQELALKAIGNNAPTSVIQAIQGANTLADAIKAGGQYLATSQNDFVKVGDNTLLVDKLTGKIIKNYGGGTSSSGTGGIGTGDPIIRTVKGTDGKSYPVSGYTIKKGEDPYNIAQQLGTDMTTLQKLNPNITDWHNIQPGAVLNVPNKTVGTGSILAATGLSSLEFNYMTQGTSALTRLSAAQRLATIASADAWARAHGTDTATIQAQYKAYNETLQSNIKRNNNTIIAEGELLGTIENLKDTADAKEFAKLKAVNVAKLFAGKQLNDPLTLKYAVHLNQLRTELAFYNAAVAGKNEVTESDKRDAELVIKNGLNSKSLTGFTSAIESSVEKMKAVLQGSVDRSSQSIWNLFGVGDQYLKQYPNTTAPQQNLDPLNLGINTLANNNPLGL